MSINTNTTASRLALPQTVRSAKFYRRLQLKMQRQTFRRRVIRLSLLASNVVVLAVILTIVLQNQHSTTVSAKPLTLASQSQAAITANPLDQLSSADIALTVASLDSLPETTAIANQAETQAADLATASINDNVVSKPQVVVTALKSRADIQTYVTQSGDSVASIASKFGVTSASIQWSNGLNGNTVNAGVSLTIPPVNGIVYTVKAGDTPDSLASKFNANKDQIIAYNDAEISGLQPGEQIIIPNGSVAAAVVSNSSSGYGSYGVGSFTALYGGNGYDYGYCTWYVATQVSVPTNWGNASSWAYYARLSGWTVSSVPVVGAIAQTPYAAGGEGHVAIVDAVSPDGSQIQYRDMNGIAGYAHVGQSGWVSASLYPNYIYH